MNDVGYYDGWTSHRVTVQASLAHGFVISVSGKNRNGIKDYISEVFDAMLASAFDWIEVKK